MAMLDDFKARFPNIDSTLADTLVPVYELEYSCYYGGDYTNDCDKNAILLLVAHLVVSDPSYKGNDSPNRLQSSKSVGSVSTSYAAGGSASDMSNWLNTTAYGQRFLMITASNIGVAVV